MTISVKIVSGKFHDFARYAVRFHADINNTENPPKDYKFRLCRNVHRVTCGMSSNCLVIICVKL